MWAFVVSYPFAKVRRKDGAPSFFPIEHSWLLGQTEDLAVLFCVGRGTSKVVEGALRYADDVFANELCPFAGAILGMLDAALPLDDGPSWVAILRHLAEDSAEVGLAVA